MQINTPMKNISEKACRKLLKLICAVLSWFNLSKEVFFLALLIHSIVCSYINFYLSLSTICYTIILTLKEAQLPAFLLVFGRQTTHPMNVKVIL